ncbi:GntR family transcriptional regulator [Izhakiella australiensis]|uniref:GntR family transcriptional regulator n=1 Tax=Izhakiella australiensis TaxID=1926881 RepID=A0A1S8YIR3_9GAMM|nr:aminotransferase class I/II-fold pyridoxal phosphate-dependent enzyme [Izhakiella australiensis]OON38778.1 GntR family transcriptional regulator [Izhakiella australiensis]
MAVLLDPDWLAQRLSSVSVKGIASTTANLIREGQIAIGTQLPAVRTLAEKLGVSPATVSAAWSQLKRQKVIAGKGRGGVWVCGNNVTPGPVRFETIGNYGDNVKANLAMAVPDPALLPDLSEALLKGAKSPALNSYRREPIAPPLLEAIKPGWPVDSGSFMATNGGFEAMNLIVQTLLSPGDRVIIEDPTATRLLDMLDNAGAEILPLPCDEEGPQPDALRLLLNKKPVMFIHQPRTHSATGNTVSKARSAALSQALIHSSILIVEDDGIGELSCHAVWSLGRYYPERTLYVRSYSKAYGPDLRLAVISGPASLLKRIQSWRQFGASWTSRILQEAVAWMLHDPATQQQLQLARKTYAQRRQLLIEALARRGLHLPQRDGLSVCIPVASEQFAMITLAARGIAALPGERCRSAGSQFIRVSTSLIPPQQIASIADALVLATGMDLAAGAKSDI